MFRILVLLFICWAGLASAVEPDEVMPDTRLEERARMISQGLRCLQCRNESIDESNAAIAKDLRILVRERLAEGDSNKEVMDFIISRYGEYISLQPNMQGRIRTYDISSLGRTPSTTRPPACGLKSFLTRHQNGNCLSLSPDYLIRTGDLSISHIHRSSDTTTVDCSAN